MNNASSAQFKTKPFAHQLRAYNLSRDAEYFALLMEQGTGKSKVVIDTCAYLYGAGRIDALIVVSPNGVQHNWVLNEIPAHMPDYCNALSAWWGTSRKQQKVLAELFDVRRTGLRVITINVEAVTTKKGRAFLNKCLLVWKCLLAVDESHRIKNPKALCSKALHAVAHKAPFRRILTGTPVTQSPVDLFSQFYFLDEWVMGTDSFVAFKAQYCELLPPGSGLLRHIEQRMKPGLMRRYNGNEAKVRAHMDKYLPQVVATDAKGNKKYKNLDKLQTLIAPHSLRVRKADCLDLPDKLYQRVYHELSAPQRRLYDDMKNKLRIEMKDGSASVATKLTSLVRLQQLVGGHQPDARGEYKAHIMPTQDNPRIAALLDSVQELEGGVIVWARFRQQLEDIAACLKDADLGGVVQYHGGISGKDRVKAVDKFQSGEAKFFVAQPHSGGVGLTLTAARTVIYYSNDFSLETRLQSEDRAHRIGQHHAVTYIDIEAVDTLDVRIIGALRSKKNVADLLTGDPTMAWL